MPLGADGRTDTGEMRPHGCDLMASEQIHQQYLEINHSPPPVLEAESELAEPIRGLGLEACCYRVLVDGGSSAVEMPTDEVTSSVTGAVLKQKQKLRDSR